MSETDATITDVIPEEAFVDSRDAMTWARAFCSRLRSGVFDEIDEGLLVGWFANYAAVVEREAAARPVQQPVEFDVQKQQVLLHAPLSDETAAVTIVPLPTDSLLVLTSPARIPQEELGYVAASLQSLVDHLKPQARGAIVLEVGEDGTAPEITSVDPAELRKIGLRWLEPDEL